MLFSAFAAVSIVSLGKLALALIVAIIVGLIVSQEEAG